MSLRWFYLLPLLVFACQRGERRRAVGSAAGPTASAAPGARSEEADIRVALATLRREEAELRAHTDFATLPPSSRSLGPNPYALRGMAGTPGYVGILRGDSRVVLLDGQLEVVSSLATAPSPSALATVSGGHVFVAGPLAAALERFRVVGGELEPNGALALPGGTVARALVADDRALILADFVGDRLLSLPLRAALAVPPGKASPRVTSSCQGPFRLALTAHYVAVDCLFEHAVLVLARDGTGEPGREVARIVHDGPLWSMALLEQKDELLIGAGGVEDHPLDRRDRAFGYVDSYLYLYALEQGGTLVRREALNLGDFGVITPKSLALEERDGAPVLTAFGYGSAGALELRPGASPTFLRSVPGCSDVVVRGERRVCANPLLDAWVDLPRGGEPQLHPVPRAAAGDPPSGDRLGEALFFTALMAPDAASTGRLSRFTCETCHFEGATDGRVHNSGRGEIRVSTRPLFGLFNDAPHFHARTIAISPACVTTSLRSLIAETRWTPGSRSLRLASPGSPRWASGLRRLRRSSFGARSWAFSRASPTKRIRSSCNARPRAASRAMSAAVRTPFETAARAATPRASSRTTPRRSFPSSVGRSSFYRARRRSSGLAATTRRRAFCPTSIPRALASPRSGACT